MTVVNSDSHLPDRGQHNYGSGTFVGRDNYGPINAIDPTTTAILEKLSRSAPRLGELLRRALEDGVVSPDVAVALEFAARSINEDVASALLSASRNINEDVAMSLMMAAEKFKKSVELYDTVANSASQKLDDTVSAIGIHADQIVNVTSPPPAQIVVDWRYTFYAFLLGIVLGIVFILWLVHR